MKSLRDEIPLRGERRGGFDFIRAEICAANREDLTVRSTISFRKAYGAAEIGVRRRVHLYYDLAKAVKDSDTLYSEIEKTESELR